MPANAVLPSRARDARTCAEAPGRLLVCWQDPVSRRYHAVGTLSYGVDGYRFSYLRRAAAVEGFRPLLGFPELGRRYASESLFPLFAERVMDASRPDRPRWLASLNLAEDATPMEILARSGGHRQGDTLELLPVPAVEADGSTSASFLVHGVRHKGEAASERITQLTDGEQLRLRDEPTNDVNPEAVLVCDRDGLELGYVPDPLVEYVHTVRRASDPTVTVVRANGPDVGPHLRLLARMDGTADPSYRPFTGRGWEPAD